MWSKKQITHHKKAAKLLIKIKDLTFRHIQKNKGITEYQVQQFILKNYKDFGLITDKFPPIVAFNESSSTPEFYPEKNSKKLKKSTFILIDLWAKLKAKDAPFADITWVAFYGKRVPKRIQRVFNIAIAARTAALEHMETELKKGRTPTGKDMESAAFKIIKEAGHGKNIRHSLGHSIGTRQGHGPKPDWIYNKNSRRLHKNLAYTIEPGIYLKNRFGVRSEMDFFISKDDKIILTTDLQKRIILI
ncbi:MAG: M24 family metallopeptidase [Candidatus Aenigmarchaeota archaeon]|nr:M24 family metallopeptidase [Candidatus Aenigmarchaeota archaeon]